MTTVFWLIAVFGAFYLVVYKFCSRWPKIQIFLSVIFCVSVIAVGRIGLGTFLIDYFMLITLGFLNSRWLYGRNGPVTRLKPKKTWRRFLLLLYPISFLSLWILGSLAYWDFISSGGAYFGLVPESWIGTPDGNDFMWNGFLIRLLGTRVVPLSFIPTYNFCLTPLNVSLLTLWSIVIEIGEPAVLWWAILKGQAHSKVPLPTKKRTIEVLIMTGWGALASFAVICITLFLVYIVCA